jgi:hypothetical protein
MIPVTLAATVAAMILAARAMLDGRTGDAALCLALTLAGFALWGAAL